MHLHKLTYTGAGGTPPKAKPAISIATGKRIVVPLPAIGPEGRVERVYVKQASGTARAFDVRVQSTKVTYGDGSGSPADYNAAVTGNPDLFDVIEKQLAVTSGTALDFRDPAGAPGRGFVTEDGTTRADPTRLLYLVIIPNNTADTTTWDVTVLMNSDVG